MSETVASQNKLKTYFENAHFSHQKWLTDFQALQFNQFLQTGLPTRRDELWKYTEIKEESIPLQMGLSQEGVTKDFVESSIQLVFVNGHFSETLSSIKSLPSGVTLCSVREALQAHEEHIKPFLLKEMDEKRFPFAKLNSATFTDGLFLNVAQNIVFETPIHLLFIQTKQHAFGFSPRNIINIEANSHATVFESYLAENAEQYFTNSVTDIEVAENARLHYYKIQKEDDTATHVANIFVTQQQDSHVKLFSFSNGSHLAREDVTVFQQARGAETYLHGLYLLNQNQQHVDHHIHIDHLASHGTSSMLYKGILDKKSRAVFNGKVFVHPHTEQIQAHQGNHNLLLSDMAEINTKPELEIYAEDVKCTHGATIGQLDKEALFYLMSRGIKKEEAEHMLIRAFAEEIYSKITDAAIREFIQKRMSI